MRAALGVPGGADSRSASHQVCGLPPPGVHTAAVCVCVGGGGHGGGKDGGSVSSMGPEYQLPEYHD